MDRNTLENSTVQSVEQEYQDEQNSSQEWVLSQHSAHQQTLQFLKHLDLLTNGMGLVSEMYHIIYSLIPHTHTQIRKTLPDSAVKYCKQYIRLHTQLQETGQSIYRCLIQAMWITEVTMSV